MEIRKAKESDKDFILLANREIDRASYIEISNLKQNLDSDVFQKNKAECLLAVEDNHYLGMVLFSKVYWADRGEGIYVSQVYVSPKFRKRGIFKKLLKAVYDFDKNTNFVTCLVSKKNQNMIDCMHNLGFEDENMISYVKNKEDFEKLMRD